VLVLLAALPYLVAIVVNWMIVSQSFRPGGESEPGIRNALLLAPVAIGGLTPLVLLARKGVSNSDKGLLALAAVLAVAFCVIILVALGDTARALKLQDKVTIGGMVIRWLRGWQLILACGSALLIFGGVASIVVAGD
jgi:hypothetical protein